MSAVKNSPGSRIASARAKLGLSQSDLARGAGISRQAVFQIETGGALPRVDTAVRIARLLGGDVESLFGKESALLMAEISADAGTRVDLIRLDGRWIAHPSDDPDRMGAGFPSSDGLIAEANEPTRIQPHASAADLAENVFLAGCDPALEMLAHAATRAVRRGRCVWIPCGNEAALGRLVRGEAHMAGIHFGGTSDAANLAAIRKHGLDRSCIMLRFSSWEQGWMISRSADKNFRGIESLAGTRLRLANREAGSGCRIELDRMAKRAGVPVEKIKGYEAVTRNHAGCARAIASGFADVGLGCAAMAKAFGLEFSPTVQVAFDLVIRRDQRDKPLVRAICDLIQSGTFLRELAGVPGYETSASGRVLIS